MKEVNFKEPFGKTNKILRMLWSIVWTIFARPIPRNLASKWNIFLLKVFGAKIHSTCTVYSSAKISMPWNLVMEEHSCIANNVIIENSAIVALGAYSIISQYSYICTASHDIRDINFPQYSKPIIFGRKSWVAAKCFVGPGVIIGEGAVIGASSSIFKNVEPWTVVGGNPAKIISKREFINL